MDLAALGITKEEVLNLAARKLADEAADSDYIEGSARKLIEASVKQIIAESLLPKIDGFLHGELQALVSKEIVPVDIWGDSTGKPTTIRAALAERARDYWSVKVDNDGKPTNYYGAKPRHEWMFGEIVKEEFAKAINQDLVNIVGALKDAIIDDCNKTVRAKIDELIRVKTQK